MKLRAAVVGVGYLGRFHAQKYKMLDDVELVAICDLEEDKTQAIGTELGVPSFTNYKDLLGKTDIVTVAASTSAHFEIAQFFLENDVHVLVEKPMTCEVSEAEILCQLADKKSLKLQVGHVERFNPAWQSVQEKLKIPLFIECHRLAPFKPRGVDVDVVFDLMIHDIDVILSIVNSPLRSVSAAGTPVMTPYVDIANARLEFESGTIANLTASRVSQSSKRKFRIFQPDQYLSMDFESGDVSLLTKTGEWEEGELPIDSEFWNLEKGDALLAETKSFVHSVINDKPCLVTGKDGLVAMRIVEQILNDIKWRLEKR